MRSPRARRPVTLGSVLVLVLVVAFADALAGVASAQGNDPRPVLESRLTAQRSLVAQLMTAAQLASTAPGLSAGTRARIERLAKEGVAAIKAGRDGAASRSFYRAIAAGLGRPWTPRDEYARSLTLRARPTVADPAGTIQLELAQLFEVDYAPSGLLTVRATVRRDDATAGGSGRGRGGVDAGRSAHPDGEGGAARTGRDLGSYEGVPIDLVHWPWAFPVAAGDLDDGSYVLTVEVLEPGDAGAAPLRRVEAPLRLVRDLERARADVERRLAALEVRPDTAASVRYPFDLALQVNLGRVEPGELDFRGAIDESLALVERLESGVDPLYRATGDVRRHYLLEEAGEIMPYRLIVPESYDGTRPFPLVLALHGRGGNEDTMAIRPSGITQSLARRHGYIVASPMGYRPDGGYGTLTADLPFAGPVRVRNSVLSERDALEVLERVVAEYRIDSDRIYLVGHSGGGGGVWRFASRDPGRWAAVSPISTLVTLELHELERMRHVPVLVCHGDADPLAPVAIARTMVERMRSLEMTHDYLEVPGGGHDLVDESLPAVFAFFDRHRRVEVARPE